MSENASYLIGAVIIVLGLRIVYKGYVAKSRARMLLGAAAIPPGVGLFLPKNSPWVPFAMGVAVAMFVLSLFFLRREIAAMREGQASQPPQPESRRRRRR